VLNARAHPYLPLIWVLTPMLSSFLEINLLGFIYTSDTRFAEVVWVVGWALDRPLSNEDNFTIDRSWAVRLSGCKCRSCAHGFHSRCVKMLANLAVGSALAAEARCTRD
jgi:hypothetical protein